MQCEGQVVNLHGWREAMIPRCILLSYDRRIEECSRGDGVCQEPEGVEYREVDSNS